MCTFALSAYKALILHAAHLLLQDVSLLLHLLQLRLQLSDLRDIAGGLKQRGAQIKDQDYNRK